VNWNTRDLLCHCLQSIIDTIRRARFEIWVINNGSTDGSVEMIEQEFPQVQLVCNDANMGFAKANNIGIQRSRGRYVCLINSDVQLLDGCLDRLFEYMELNPNIALAGPRILNSDRSLQISCYAFPTVFNTLCHSFGLDRLFPRSNRLGGLYRKYWPYDTVRRVEVVSGCFCMVRREAIEKVGLLDENFFMYMEDFDWCKRFRDAGLEIQYFPYVAAVHYGGGSSGHAPQIFTIEAARSSILYWRKHHGRIGMLYISFLLFVRHLLRVIVGKVWCWFKPSDKVKLLSKIQTSRTCLHWLLCIPITSSFTTAEKC